MVPRFNWFEEIHNCPSWQHWQIRIGRDLNQNNSAYISSEIWTKRYLPLRLLHEWAFVLLHFSWSLKVDKGKEFRKKSDDIFPEKEALLNFSKFRLLAAMADFIFPLSGEFSSFWSPPARNQNRLLSKILFDVQKNLLLFFKTIINSVGKQYLTLKKSLILWTKKLLLFNQLIALSSLMYFSF